MNIFTEIHEKAWKDSSINLLLISLCWFGGVALFVSLFRADKAGLQISHFVQISVFILVVFTTLFRNKLSIRLKAAHVIITTTLVSFAGIYNWGLYSASFFWLLFTPLLLTLFFSYKHALWFIAVTIIFMVGCAYMYNTGYLKMPVDADDYQKMYSAWATVLFGDLFMMVMLVVILSNMKQHIMQLIANLEEKQKKITQIADHDDLTGLPVFRILLSNLKGILLLQHREQRNIAVLFMDLDGFKTINDTYGHHAGDFVLKETAKRMKTCLREQDILARMGGDEFVALCSSPRDKAFQVEEIAQRLLDAVSEPIEFDGKLLEVGISIGISVYRESHTDFAEDMLREADMNMYVVKNNGKNFYMMAAN